MIAVAAMALVLYFGAGAISNTAYAMTGNNCDTSSSNIQDYITAGCAFSGTMHKAANDYLRLNVLNSTGAPTTVSNQINQAISNWTFSSANVVLTNGGLPNIQIVPFDPAGRPFDTDPNCGGTWGYTIFNTSSNHSAIYLNYHYWDASHSGNPNCNAAGWLTTTVHELGHAMGLGHNNIGTNPHQIMNGCSGYTCANRATTPQSIDTWIFNLKYPYSSAT